MENLNKKIVNELLASEIKTREELMALKRRLAKKFGKELPTNTELLAELPRNADTQQLQRLLRRRSIRTMSGIAPVAVLTKPFACPGKCAYCPTEKDVPQSYLSNEPAVMRAIHCGYDPYKQVQYRLRALMANGHEPDKIELIVIGGTWSVLPVEYKYWYILNCYAAANNFSLAGRKTQHARCGAKLSLGRMKERLVVEQRRNETAKHRIIGLTLETRPDYIDERELQEMREFGCTRVELGVQAIDDKILEMNKRGHDLAAVTAATALLRRFGFKITYHLMPGLPGSTPAKDLKMFKQLFSDERFQPDQIKFYPTVVTKGSLLYDWWRQGKYKPYSDKVLQRLIVDCKAAIPHYVRIIRLVRDIPGESIIAGNTVTNLRQVMQQRGVACNCIRCREVRDQSDGPVNLSMESYDVTGGKEEFIEFASQDRKTLHGFCRLFLPAKEGTGGGFLPDTAIVRELHVYGELVPIGGKQKTQHSGLGRRLLEKAEADASAGGFKNMAVIAGVGVRGYYRKTGYRLRRSYMVKRLPA
ncbi:tRNA uridine(34) 5-carboxymethylaminomethyl modification radical SAM/GNAT enzyme Elp3 [Candidatus Falkowbacteria bacterium]|nr:tRNA uridine(34) 5-carboxymethylaminomethyl modification radical SAM/GNAT enzyme Elp3 [Candidatus Falkowbacteria bacterium]